MINQLDLKVIMNSIFSLVGEAAAVTPEMAANNALIKKLKEFQVTNQYVCLFFFSRSNMFFWKGKLFSSTIHDLAVVDESNSLVETRASVQIFYFHPYCVRQFIIYLFFKYNKGSFIWSSGCCFDSNVYLQNWYYSAR